VIFRAPEETAPPAFRESQAQFHQVEAFARLPGSSAVHCRELGGAADLVQEGDAPITNAIFRSGGFSRIRAGKEHFPAFPVKELPLPCFPILAERLHNEPA